MKMEDRGASHHLTISLPETATAKTVPLPNAPDAAATVDYSGILLENNQQQHQHEHHQQHEQQQQQQAEAGLHCQLLIECLVVSVWDDERGRLLGQASGGNQPSELCCIYWDQLNISTDRALTTGYSNFPLS